MVLTRNKNKFMKNNYEEKLKTFRNLNSKKLEQEVNKFLKELADSSEVFYISKRDVIKDLPNIIILFFYRRRLND